MLKTLIVALGCLSLWGADTAEESTPEKVEVTLTAQASKKRVTFSGTANLKDGAVITYEVGHQLHLQQPTNPLDERGSVTVKDGRFLGSTNITKWPRGNITVWIGFMPFAPTQPAWVKEEFGPGGTKLDGPKVKKTQLLHWIEMAQVVAKK